MYSYIYSYTYKREAIYVFTLPLSKLLRDISLNSLLITLKLKIVRISLYHSI